MMKTKQMIRTVRLRFQVLAGFLAMTLVSDGFAQGASGKEFASPKEAVEAFQAALSAKDLDQLKVIFGPALTDIINPDPVEATNEFVRVVASLQETNSLVPVGEHRFVLQYGSDESWFPVPIIQKGGRWQFDTPAGVEELTNRRIGRNELAVLEVIRTYVQAQREYASADRDNDEVLEYAQRFGSTPRQKDGLYWSPEIDGTLSPLGPLVAEAEAVGYRKRSDIPRQPFHGYFFKILTRQGKNAPGGEYDYIINGNMIGGFALVAWPVEYDRTGVMTFLVNQQGRVYQKDLGTDSDNLADSLKSYDPDKTWVPSRE